MRPDQAELPYPERIALDEYRFLLANFGDDTVYLGNMPHVRAFLEARGVRSFLMRLQEFCWTCGRLLSLTRHQARNVFGDAPLHVEAGHPVPSVWIDVTNTYRSNAGGGIARVARELARAAWQSRMAIPVIVKDGGVFSLSPRGELGPLDFTPDTTLVFVDTFWSQLEECLEQVARARDHGAKTLVCIHDIIPLQIELFHYPSFVETFRTALRRVVAETDGFIAVSKTTMSEVERYVENDDLLPGRAGGWFHLGANSLTDAPGGVRQDIADFGRSEPIFLSVGTVEPRKGYALTLDAFDLLWSRGLAVKFVIVGRAGWMSKALQHRLLKHPMLGQSLFWFQDANDAELSSFYRMAHCVIQASFAEGFGLPIVEAIEAGVPIIASDIPIFRELAGDTVTYFAVSDVDGLAAAIVNAHAVRPQIPSKRFPDWRQSLERLVEVARTLSANVETMRS